MYPMYPYAIISKCVFVYLHYLVCPGPCDMM
uniref:Uncharacterized protein n=1 Tax=Anguilla anguilla TaxID=7936 RepID=A0A0E9QPA4_ANGAN